MKSLVSIIIPVYNSVDYLEESLNSVLGQSMTNIEIICVDDGSTDKSGDILDRYEKKDARVRVIHKEHIGQVDAIKKGISMAQSEYIGFVDSDDWVDEEMFETLYTEMVKNDVDLVSSGMICGPNKIVFDGVEEKAYVTRSDMRELFSVLFWQGEQIQVGIAGNRVTKLFKKNILQEFCMDIDERIHFWEDGCLVYAYALRCRRIKVIHKAFYHYRNVTNSDSRRCDDLFFARLNYAYLFLRDHFQKSEYADLLMQQLDIQYSKVLISGINERGGLRIDAFVFTQTQQLNHSTKIAIYGAGVNGRRFAERLSREGIKPIAIFDQRADLPDICDVKVSPLSDLKKYEYDKIVITIKKPEISDEVRCMLIERGIEGKKILCL